MGIAFQSLKHEDVENTGYVIPTPVIRHFILDYEKNGAYTGNPSHPSVLAPFFFAFNFHTAKVNVFYNCMMAVSLFGHSVMIHVWASLNHMIRL